MSLDRLVARWVGVTLTLIGVIATVALVATDQLSLYIHPRYTLFTVAMVALAGLASVAAMLLLPLGGGEHDHDDEHSKPSRQKGSWTLARVLIVVVAAVALLVLPPATLTASTLQNRDIASPSRIQSGTDIRRLVGTDPASLSIKDWAGLLEQGGPAAVVDRPVAVSGYVLDRGNDSVFFLARMLVTCCAVDGQPVVIPVYQPGWREQHRPSEWLSIRGAFVETNSAGGAFDVVLEPDTTEKISEPEQPYVF